MAQQVKAQALWVLWCRFNPWPSDFYASAVAKKKKKKKEHEINVATHLKKKKT